MSQVHPLALQARCFSQGLAFNPSDRMLQQGYWDALNLMSQSRAGLGTHAALQPSQSGASDELQKSAGAGMAIALDS
jgi:hypothetical protein